MVAGGLLVVCWWLPVGEAACVLISALTPLPIPFWFFFSLKIVFVSTVRPPDNDLLDYLLRAADLQLAVYGDLDGTVPRTAAIGGGAGVESRARSHAVDATPEAARRARQRSRMSLRLRDVDGTSGLASLAAFSSVRSVKCASVTCLLF